MSAESENLRIQEEVLESLRDVHTRAGGSDPNSLFAIVGAGPTRKVGAELVSLLSELTDSALRSVAKLPVLEQSVVPESAHGAVVKRGMSLADSVFAARMELRAAQQLLDGCSGKCGIETAEQAWRRIRRATAAVIASLADDDPIPLGDTAIRELQNSLKVRSVYAHLWRSLPLGEPAGEADVLAFLRKTTNALAGLVGGPNFTRLRIADRQILRDLQDRCIEWAKERDLRDGRKLCADIRATFDLLTCINQRQELQAHDAGVIQRALDALGGGAPEKAWAEIFPQLRVLDGRDRRLDALLARGHAEAWPQESVALLKEIARDLGVRDRADMQRTDEVLSRL